MGRGVGPPALSCCSILAKDVRKHMINEHGVITDLLGCVGHTVFIIVMVDEARGVHKPRVVKRNPSLPDGNQVVTLYDQYIR